MRLKICFEESAQESWLYSISVIDFIKGDLHCTCVAAQIIVGPCAIDCGDVFTGYYYDLNFCVFVKLAHKKLQVYTSSYVQFIV